MACKPSKKNTNPHGYILTGKEGSGLYSDVNLSHQEIITAAMPLVLEAVETIVINKGSVFTIVDYGTADGGMSMPIIYACVKAIQAKYGEELPITVIYEDQPINDFKSLFTRIHGLIPGSPTFIQDFQNVFVMASGTSFYEQCFPKDSVNLGLSTTAMHWLRDKPCDISNALFHVLITVPEEREKFRRQAMIDWELILLNRSAEMKQGAKMVIAIPCIKDYFPEHLSKEYINMYTSLWDILKSLADEGIITTEEMKNTNVNIFLRTIDDIKKPFQCSDSPVNQTGLELVSITTREFQCRHLHKWVNEKGDAKQHAKEFVTSIRTWTNSTFLKGLSDSRSAEDKALIVNEIYHRYEAEVSKHPEQHGLFSCFAFIVVKKGI